MAGTKAKKVTITMKSISTAPHSTPDIIELITEGTFRPVSKDGNDGWEIAYEDSEATGFEGSKTIVTCFGEEIASMNRVGSTESHLIMEKGRRHHCHYGTEFGHMLLGIHTSKIINRLTADGGELYIKYTIDINSALISDNEVYLNIRFSEK